MILLFLSLLTGKMKKRSSTSESNKTAINTSVTVTDPVKPVEPDWNALKEEYDRDGNLDDIEVLILLSKFCWKKVRRMIRSMRKFTNQVIQTHVLQSQQLQSQQSQQSQSQPIGQNQGRQVILSRSVARDMVQQQGRITSTAINIARAKKVTTYINLELFYNVIE
jgi:hypothetical protein